MFRPLPLAAALPLAMSMAWSQSSYAECIEDPAETVICAADDSDGFDDDSRDDMHITVNAGVTVSNEGEAIRVDDDLTLVNNGVITSSGDDGVQADNDANITNNGSIFSTADEDDGIQVGSDAVIVNNGAIASTKDGVNAEEGLQLTNALGATIAGDDDGVQAEDDATVVNHGTITSGDKGIDTEGFDNLEVTNTGLIDAADKGIRAGADDDGEGGSGFVLNNSGTITAGDEAIETGDGAQISNAGTIESEGDDAIQLGEDAIIVNAESGQILSAGGDGIDVDSGQIINEGVIRSTAEGEAGIDVDEGDSELAIINTGEISGEYGILVENGLTDPVLDPANTQSQNISNYGLIEGTGGIALSLWEGDDTLSLFDGATIVGDAYFGGDNDRLNLLGSDLGLVANLFDGGEGLDTVDFGLNLFSNVQSLFWDGSAFDLTYAVDDVSWDLRLSNWEQFYFNDVSFDSVDAFRAVATYVPLPSTVGLLALGALVLAPRRRRR